MTPLPQEVDVPTEDDSLQQQFYGAVMASNAASTGDSALDTLLAKGLYGSKLPKPLRGQRAADAFQNAFELIGGVPRLALWADKNPTAFFSLYSKLIPATVKAQVDTTITVVAPWMSNSRLSYKDVQTIEMDVAPKDSE